MKIIGSERISHFAAIHPDAAVALIKWLNQVEAAHPPLPNHSYPVLIAEIRRKIDQQGIAQK